MKIHKLSLTAAAVFALVAAVGLTANAFTFSQRVLVYCPPSDTAGCETIIAALGNADRGYDGANETIDLRSADLSAYAVLVIPSLADDGDVTPYAFLRDSAVASHLRKSVTGRRAFWSGTPDQGTSNREAKNALLSRLAAWAGGNHVAAGAPGLLVLQDASTSAHYNWVSGITGINVIADPAIRSYSAVRAVTAIGSAIVGDAAYTNMASRGFFLPQGAAGISLDVVGQTGTTVGGQIVLMTHPGATEHQAVVSTDKDDYEPYETVVISGSGFLAGESVLVTLEEDPMQHELRSFTVIADENGAFVYTQFTPEEHDIDVRFILTAKGGTSNRVSQTTFTDAIVRAATLYFGVGHASPNDSLVVPAPATATVAGDVLIAQITVAELTAGVICAPGWVLERSDSAHEKVRQAIFSRVVTVGEAGGTLHTFTFRGGGGASCPSGGSLVNRASTGHITRYSGVDNADPVEIAGGTASTSSGTTFTAPSVTTALSGARVMRFVGVFKNVTLTGPAGSVKLYGTGSSTNKERHAAAWDTTQASPGATGTFAATGSSAEWVAQTVVLRPAAAAKAAGSVSINNIPGVGVAIIGGSFNPAYTKLGDGTASTTSLTTGVCTVSGGTVNFIAAGQCDLQASVTEGTAHLAATGTTQSFNIGKAAGSVSINNIPGVGVAIIGGSFNPAYTKLGDGTASTTSLTTGICTVSGGTVSFIAAGQCDLQASVTEGTAHLAATGTTQSFNIGKAAGSVSINNIPGVGVAIIGGSFNPAYTKLGDGTASTTSLTTGICTVSGGTVSFIAAGQCDLQASVTEGTAHLAATGTTQSFNIGKAAGSVSINNIPGVGVAIVGGSFDPAYTKLGDGTASTTSLTTGICTVSGGTVSFIAAGQCDLQASVTEGTAHLAATGTTQSFNIGKAAGSVSINNIPGVGVAIIGGSFNPAYTKLGDGTASTTSLTTGICTVSGGTVSFIAAGQCDLQASVTEGTAHLAATGTTQSFNIGKAAGSVSINNIPGVGVAIIGGSFDPAYTKLGDGTASTTSLTTGICTVSGGTVSFIAAGQCDLQASVTEGTAHLAATGTTQSFNIGKAAGSVSINNIPGVGVAIIGGSFNPAYTKLGDGTASTTSLTTGICTVSGGTVSFIAAGQCDLQASVTEGTAHLAATGTTQSFNIGKAAGSVSINNIPGVGVAIVGGSFNPAYTKLGDGTASTTSLTTGICTVSGGTVSFIAAGQCDLQASVTEGTAHLAATGTTQSFNIGKAAGSVSINNIPGVGVAIVGGSFVPAYTKLGAGTASTVSLTTSVCTVTSGTVNFIAGGECRLQASVTESATHLAATGAEQPFTIGKAPGSVSINNIPGAALVGGSFVPGYTKLGAGTASTVSLTTSICTVTAGTVNFMAAGQCDLQASITESATHLAATGATQSFSIGAAATSTLLTVVPASQQYSDSTVFTATVTPYEAGSQQLTGTVHFYVGAGIQACGTSAPAGAVGNDAVADADNGLGTLRYPIDKAAGAYKVTACFYSSSASFVNSNDDENLTVRAEDATVYDISYSPNPLQVPTPTGSFTFKIRETNPESNDPNLTAAGNISLAVADVNLKGVLYPSGTYDLACTAGALSAGTGYAVYRSYSCILPAGIAADTYEAEIVVNNNGYYTDTTSTVVQVTDPNAGFATGGGWYTMENGDKVNFGFMAKSTVNNRKTVYQGSLLVIRHTSTGQVIKAKSNVFDGYSIKTFTGGASASFSGKANYTVDGVSIGNFAFTGYAEDWGTPGVGVDEFGLYLASAGNQVGTSATLAGLVNSAKKLEGGNTQVPQPSKK